MNGLLSVFPFMGIEASELAKAMIYEGLEASSMVNKADAYNGVAGSATQIFENAAILEIAKRASLSKNTKTTNKKE